MPLVVVGGGRGRCALVGLGAVKPTYVAGRREKGQREHGGPAVGFIHKERAGGGAVARLWSRILSLFAMATGVIIFCFHAAGFEV